MSAATGLLEIIVKVGKKLLFLQEIQFTDYLLIFSLESILSRRFETVNLAD